MLYSHHIVCSIYRNVHRCSDIEWYMQNTSISKDTNNCYIIAPVQGKLAPLLAVVRLVIVDKVHKVKGVHTP